MPRRNRGNIITVRLVKRNIQGRPPFPLKPFSEEYVGTLQPVSGGTPIPFSTVHKVGKGDSVLYDGVKRAVKVKPVSLRSTGA